MGWLFYFYAQYLHTIKKRYALKDEKRITTQKR
jgi:hypothetical protein